MRSKEESESIDWKYGFTAVSGSCEDVEDSTVCRHTIAYILFSVKDIAHRLRERREEIAVCQLTLRPPLSPSQAF